MYNPTSKDLTLELNYKHRWQVLIREYELIKAKKHSHFRFVSDFYKHHGTSRQNFIKYYNRFKNLGHNDAFLPLKRGPKYKKRLPLIENQVIKYRKHGLNRYEIYQILSPLLKDNTPSASQIYRICVKHNLNRLNTKMKEKKRKIIKEIAGEMGHVDCHYLPAELFLKPCRKRHYLVGIIDSCTRLAWVELVHDIKSLTVMFATLKSINMLNHNYNIQFREILSDNGAEFGSGPKAKNKDTNPFEKLLQEMGIKHRYTRPYRPQTNGKIERFWRTLNEDLIDGTVFEDVEELKKELFEYMFYYNEHRQHSALDYKTPKEVNNSVNEIEN